MLGTLCPSTVSSDNVLKGRKLEMGVLGAKDVAAWTLTHGACACAKPFLANAACKLVNRALVCCVRFLGFSPRCKMALIVSFWADAESLFFWRCFDGEVHYDGQVHG